MTWNNVPASQQDCARAAIARKYQATSGLRPDRANCVDRPDHIIFVVDDDPRIRESLCELLSSADLHAVPFGSASDFLAYPKPDLPSCLVLDVGLPDINGLELQSRIGQDEHPPIVFVIGQGHNPP